MNLVIWRRTGSEFVRRQSIEPGRLARTPGKRLHAPTSAAAHEQARKGAATEHPPEFLLAASRRRLARACVNATIRLDASA